MKNLRKWTALAAVMAMTATLFTGCGSTDAPASEATAPAAESTAAATTETGAEAPATNNGGSRRTGNRRPWCIESRR